MEFVEAGYYVVLAEPNRDVLTDGMWKKVEETGVKITHNDVEAVKYGLFYNKFQILLYLT